MVPWEDGRENGVKERKEGGENAVKV